MFNGFSDETFEFFMAIRFNNNRDFFHANHDWYVDSVRRPCLELAEALGPTVEAVDADFDVRPNRVVARINRDIRFSHDKSPYRDHIWLSFRHAGESVGDAMSLYFEITPQDGGSYGTGFYNANKPLMNGLRRQIRQNPGPLLEIWRGLKDEFTLHPNTIKRMKVPDDIPEELRAWYPLRGFYLEKELPDFGMLKSPALLEELKSGYMKLRPLYQYFRSITPEEEDSDE